MQHTEELTGHGMAQERPNDQESPFISVKETAALLRVSRLTVYRRYHAGLLPGRKLGRSIGIYRPFVEDLLSEISLGRPIDVEAFAAAWANARANVGTGEAVA